MSDTRHTRSEKKSFGQIVRYDNQSCNKCMTVWVCKCCKTCFLSENAISSHIINCPEKDLRPTPSPEPIIQQGATVNQHLQHNSDKSNEEEDEDQLYFSDDDILKIII